MADFADELLDNFAQMEHRIVPDKNKRKRMTAAAAEVEVKNLSQVTREKHYQANREPGKVKHLADSVVWDNTDIDGEDNGNSVFGFAGVKESGINHARIARLLNDGFMHAGSKKRAHYIAGDHFYEEAREKGDQLAMQKMNEVYNNGTSDSSSRQTD